MTEQKMLSPVTKYSALIIEDKQLSTSRSADIFCMTAASRDARCIQVRLNLTMGMETNIKVHAEWIDRYLESCVLHNEHILKPYKVEIQHGFLILTALHILSQPILCFCITEEMNTLLGALKFTIHFSKLSRPALGSTQPPIKWVPVALSAG
jgi:hypothetical protein